MDTPLPPPQNYPRAALFALAGYLWWTVADALIKLARMHSIAQGPIMLIVGFGAVSFVLAFTSLRGGIRRLKPHRWRGLFALGLVQAAASACWITALPHLPLANMYVVVFLSPMTVAVVASLILKEPLGWKRVTAIAAGFAGVVIAINPAHMARNGDKVFYLAVFGAMAGNAAQMLLLRVLGRKESSESMTLYPRLIVVAAGAVLCVLNGFAALDARLWLVLCLAGVAGGLGWILLAQAYKNAPAAAVAPLHYSQIISGALLGYFIWGNAPDLYLFAGAAIIIASGIYLMRHERRVSRMTGRAD